MTIQSGMRSRFVPFRPSSPNGQVQSTQQVTPIVQGGTGKTTATEARTALVVAGLSDNNTLTNTNTFDGEVVIANGHGLTINTGALEVGGTTLLGRTEWGGTVLQAPTFTMSNLSLALSYVAKTANYTLTNQDIIVNVTANSPTLTLPTAVGCAGRMYIVKNSGAGTITMATTSSQTVDGVAPGTIAAGNSLTFVSDGANWILV